MALDFGRFGRTLIHLSAFIRGTVSLWKGSLIVENDDKRCLHLLSRPRVDAATIMEMTDSGSDMLLEAR